MAGNLMSLRQDSFKQRLDSIGDSLSRVSKLFDGPVFGMAGRDPADRGTTEQPAGQRGRQQEITLRNCKVAFPHALEPELGPAPLGYPTV